MNQKLIIEKNFNLALENHQKNNLQIAERIYKKILKINPNHFQSICFLGTLSTQTKNFERAKQLFYKAIEIQPNNANVHNNLGTLFKELREFQKAINYFQKALECDSENLIYAYYLSRLEKEILDPNLRMKIDKAIDNSNSSRENLAYANFLLSS